MAAQAPQRADSIASSLPLRPFLFALFPVVHLYQENIFEVELIDVVAATIVVLAATGPGLAALTLLWRDPRRAALVTSAIVLPAMLFGTVDSLIESTLGDVQAVLVVLSLAILVVAIIGVLRATRHLGGLTLGLNVISLVLVAIAVVPAAQAATAEFAADLHDDDAVRLSSAPCRGPYRDIYHVVLDRYGSAASLEAELGIDNSDFVAWLRDVGFAVVDDAYANYTKTTLSPRAIARDGPLRPEHATGPGR